LGRKVNGGELRIEIEIKNVILLEEKEIEMAFVRSTITVSIMQAGNLGRIGLVVNAHINLTRKPDRNYN
jgi:hypothetical protein